MSTSFDKKSRLPLLLSVLFTSAYGITEGIGMLHYTGILHQENYIPWFTGILVIYRYTAPGKLHTMVYWYTSYTLVYCTRKTSHHGLLVY